MFMILVLTDSSWAEVATASTMEEALAVAPEHAQIEEWDGGKSVVVRAGVYP